MSVLPLDERAYNIGNYIHECSKGFFVLLRWINEYAPFTNEMTYSLGEIYSTDKDTESITPE